MTFSSRFNENRANDARAKKIIARKMSIRSVWGRVAGNWTIFRHAEHDALYFDVVRGHQSENNAFDDSSSSFCESQSERKGKNGEKCRCESQRMKFVSLDQWTSVAPRRLTAKLLYVRLALSLGRSPLLFFLCFSVPLR